LSEQLNSLDGRVELKGLLGSGGMGEVHRAWDRRLERAVAVKFVRGQDASDAERLLLEARLQARVDHPNVVKVHEVGSLAGRPCILFQLVEGRTLAELAPSLSLEARVELVRQAGLGLHAAHVQGLVHRDVKPGNVLIEEGPTTPTALLTDFGLARAEDAALSRSGLPPGTLDYMSPEQLVAPGPVDFRSDIYSLGATLYAALAGRPPFRPSWDDTTPTGVSDVQLVRRILEEEPQRLEQVTPGVPRELGVIAAHAMEKQPLARYPSAEALSLDLGHFQRGEPIEAKPTVLLVRALKWGRRNRAVVRALSVALLALVFAGGWTLWNSRRSGLAALEAARLGGLTESMEDQLRMESLSPAHDLRPAQARLRAQVDQLRPLAARASGPANLALGKGMQLLGDLDGARAAYEAAWRAGFHTAPVSEGLGTVLGALYLREVDRARKTLAGDERDARLAFLQTELREPAKHYLTSSDASGWRAPYLQASVAMLEGDYSQARAHATEVLAQDPTRYEAVALAAHAWLMEATDQSVAQHLDESDVSLDQASVRIEEATLTGRSDASVARDRAQVHAQRANNLTKRGQVPEAELQALLGSLDRAAVLDPDAPYIERMRGGVLVQKAMFHFMGGTEDVLPLLAKAEIAYRRALALGDDDPRTLCNLGRALYFRASKLNMQGKPSLDPIREGLVAADQAEAKAPRDAEVPYIRCLLHRAEADTLRQLGERSEVALRQAIESGELALGMRPGRGTELRPIIGEARVLLAREAWLDGKDPRPALEEAQVVLLEAMKALPGQPAPVGQLAYGTNIGGTVRWAMGEDTRPTVELATAKLDEVLSRTPTLTNMYSVKGELLADEALRRAEVGENPTELAAVASAALERGAPGKSGDIDILSNRGTILLARAHWRVSHGEDPSALLAQAEAAVANVPPGTEVAAVQELLARCSLERARWLARQGRRAEEPARQGLGRIETALKAEPRDPSLWVLQAVLQGFAGDVASGKASLARAVAINPLVARGWEAKDAEAELLRH
jgi:eukaryotic-like serine/threonine-protein kinase